MSSFSMPSSWYDPPEYEFQRQAEEVQDRHLFGLYEVDPETGKIKRWDKVPDEYGTLEEMQRLYDEMVEEDDPWLDRYVIEDLSFDACCEIAEREAAENTYYDDEPNFENPPDYDDSGYW